jgi:hypothetical protein
MASWYKIYFLSLDHGNFSYSNSYNAPTRPCECQTYPAASSPRLWSQGQVQRDLLDIKVLLTLWSFHRHLLCWFRPNIFTGSGQRLAYYIICHPSTYSYYPWSSLAKENNKTERPKSVFCSIAIATSKNEIKGLN